MSLMCGAVVMCGSVYLLFVGVVVQCHALPALASLAVMQCRIVASRLHDACADMLYVSISVVQ